MAGGAVTSPGPVVIALTPPGADPVSLSIERSLIGGCLLDSRGCREWPALPSSRFFMERHRLIWDAMLDLTEVSDRPDLLMLADELRRTDKLEEVGGTLYLMQLVEEGTCCVELRRYGALVQRSAAERDRLALASALAQDPAGSEHVEAILRALEEQPGISEGLTSIYARLAQHNREVSYETGMEYLEAYAGQVTVIAGRTSHGKTAFVCDCLKRWARQDILVEMVTLEDSPEAIGARLLAGDSRKSVRYVRRSRLSGLDGERNALEMLPIKVTSVPGCREDAVVGAVAASRAEIVVVDHLQQIGLDSEEGKRHNQLERIMARFGAVARRDAKAIVLTAQLNREMDRQRRRPELADIKDSGAIEQACRACWLLYWPAKHEAKTAPKNPHDYDVIIAKASEGPTFRKAIKWDPKSGRFLDPRTEAIPDDW